MASAVSTPSRHNIVDLNRRTVNKLKNGSPKFKDTWRVRCLARMKENRGKILNKLRNINPDIDVKEFLVTLENLERENCKDKDEANENSLTREEEELIAEYEAMLESEELMFSDMLQRSLKNEVICPICQKATMVSKEIWPHGCFILCPACNIQFSLTKTLEEFEHHLHLCVDEHSTKCSNDPRFDVVPEDDNPHMYMLCDHCLYLNIIL